MTDEPRWLSDVREALESAPDLPPYNKLRDRQYLLEPGTIRARKVLNVEPDWYIEAGEPVTDAEREKIERLNAVLMQSVAEVYERIKVDMDAVIEALRPRFAALRDAVLAVSANPHFVDLSSALERQERYAARLQRRQSRPRPTKRDQRPKPKR